MAKYRFTDLLILGTFRGEHLYDDEWRLTHPLTYSWRLEREGRAVVRYEVIVPAGFQTDRSSIPRIFRSIIPRDGPHNLASILHDYLYETRMVSRKYADDLFFSFMTYCGTGNLRRWIMWGVVRAFGRHAYNT